VGRATTALAVALVTGSAMLLGGCEMANPILSSGPSPRVADCFMIGQGTPAKFVCPPDGKTYTSTQLYDIRKGKAM
jgi:hypothetical protein